MGANIAGIYGAQIFRQDDAPRYRRGFLINIIILSVGFGLATVRFIDDRIRRRRGEAVGNAIEDRQDGSEDREAEAGTVTPRSDTKATY